MNHIVLVAVLSAALTTSPALADLTLPSYLAAKKSYDADNCNATLKQLATYMQEDAAYLDANTAIKAKLEKVVAHCTTLTASGGQLIVSGATVVPAPKPKLP